MPFLYLMGKQLQGLVFDIKRFAIHDGPGIRTTIFFKGCHLACPWCHNPESQSFQIQTIDSQVFGRYYFVDELLDEIVKDQIFFEESGGGVTFSGGDPIHQLDFLLSLSKSCQRAGVHTAVDTSGYLKPQKWTEILANFDLFLYDLKCITPSLHKSRTGVSNGWILQNLTELIAQKIPTILRIPLIPSFNTSQREIWNILDFISSLEEIPPIHLLFYHKIGKHKYQQMNIPYKMTGIDELTLTDQQKIIDQFHSYGFEPQIGG